MYLYFYGVGGGGGGTEIIACRGVGIDCISCICTCICGGVGHVSISPITKLIFKHCLPVLPLTLLAAAPPLFIIPQVRLLFAKFLHTALYVLLFKILSFKE